jgi:hypothetical protein
VVVLPVAAARSCQFRTIGFDKPDRVSDLHLKLGSGITRLLECALWTPALVLVNVAARANLRNERIGLQLF